MPDVVLISLLLTLNIFHVCSIVSVVNFEHVIAGWTLKGLLKSKVTINEINLLSK